MTKKKKSEEQRDDNFGAAVAADEARYVEEARTRQAARDLERAMVLDVASAVLKQAAEQTSTLRAERFAHYARALVDLRQMGAFPAIEMLQKSALDELTVLSRELHDGRIAKVSP